MYNGSQENIHAEPVQMGVAVPAGSLAANHAGSLIANHAGLACLAQLKGRVTCLKMVQAISEAIENGLLQPGDRMPSRRQVAVISGTTRQTVANAFDKLIGLGYLRMTKRNEVMVAGDHQHEAVLMRDDSLPEIAPPFAWSNRYTQLAKRLSNGEPAILSGDLAASNWGALPADLLPMSEWRSCLGKSFQDDPLGSEFCQDVFGYLPLRKAIAAYLRRSKGVVCHPEQIVLYSGTQNALREIMQLLVRPGDLVACEEPGYAGARKQFLLHGANLLSVAIDREGIDINSLSTSNASPQWLYATTFHDPTGSTLSEARARQLLRWCERNGTGIIEDAWESDFGYVAPYAIPLFARDLRDATIYLYTFWRLLFPLTATSVAVLPEKLVPLFRRVKHIADRQFPLIEHQALCKMIESGYLEAHVRFVWKTLRKRRQALIASLGEVLGDFVRILPPGGGMHIRLVFNRQCKAEAIASAAKVARLPLVPTASYYKGDPAANEYMLNFAGLDEAAADMAVRRFAHNLAMSC